MNSNLQNSGVCNNMRQMNEEMNLKFEKKWNSV